MVSSLFQLAPFWSLQYHDDNISLELSAWLDVGFHRSASTQCSIKFCQYYHSLSMLYIGKAVVYDNDLNTILASIDVYV